MPATLPSPQSSGSSASSSEAPSQVHTMLAFLLLLASAAAAVCAAAAWPVLRVCCRSVWDYPRLIAVIIFTTLQTALAILFRGGKARFSEWTRTFEFIQSLSHAVFDKFGENMLLEANVKAIREWSGVMGTFEAKFSCREHRTTVTPVVLNGLEHLWLRGDTSGGHGDAIQERYVVLYYHGGGYSMFGPRMYITVCNRIRQAILDAVTKDTGRQIVVDVFMANYRKSPEVKFPVPEEDALRMLEYLRDSEGVKPEQTIVAGDSAGGGLVLSTLLRLRDLRDEAPQPLAAIASYPWTDFSYDPNPKRGQYCMLSRDFVRESLKAFMPTYDDASTWKDASSAYCDLRGLAPVFVQVGTLDYLYQDALKLMSKAQKDGVTNWELDIRQNMTHVFIMMPPTIVPDSAPAYARMGEFVAKQIAARRTGDPQ